MIRCRRYDVYTLAMLSPARYAYVCCRRAAAAMPCCCHGAIAARLAVYDYVITPAMLLIIYYADVVWHAMLRRMIYAFAATAPFRCLRHATSYITRDITLC